ncbi:sushi, von Willebrand factor type A, EGF and pentraxin domain-containing protein 1-like [Uloborus diversus]|uniref:sushi, von Willebrand factor type A, EGF and pentraxin domain-containing protein 1-like n=1 Tax=Uloborus diversus TaxID=327109 RepID=UPI0024092EC5|nr:sushi, von Willebrand factor type A, EGF and pentraxin domain-containing protein 1-like [Uloborus diversus]
MASHKDLLKIVLFVFTLWQLLSAEEVVTEPFIPEYDGENIVPVDPEGCPRNREEAASKGRQCLRKCGSDDDCISSRKRCLCDGLCGWSCIRPDLHCAELGTMENGHHKLQGDHFGARVMYFCEDSYWMSGPKERVCQGDGTWSDHSPECRQKAMCGIPPQVPHARHNASETALEFDVDEVVHYNCYQGYDPHGYSKAKCLFFNGTTQWYGLDLRCIPRSCDHPGEIENGRREGDIFTFTSRVTYHCDPGYELVGRANRYCQSKGEWSGVLPSCRPVQCLQPKDVNNGRVVYSAMTYKSVARYECLFGYRLVGPTTRICETNKQWEGEEPYCEEIKCGSPGILHNGYVKGSSTRFSSVIYFSCLENMTFVGESASTTCQHDGTWSHSVPKCMAPCSVPAIDHGRVTNYSPDAKVGHGKHITVDCIAQYELRYNTTPATCNNGSWTHIPTCIPARCKTLPKRPRSGMVIAPKTDHGMKALFRCKDGYKLIGPNVTECKFGRWTADTPVCNETYCPYPGLLENGRILLVGHMGMYDYRPYVKKITNNRQIMYECERHFTLVEGPPGATCVDGRWSPQEKPKCIRGSHPQVRWDRSVREKREVAIRKQRRLDMTRNKWKKRSKRKNKGICKPVESTPWMDVTVVKKGRGPNLMASRGAVIRVTCGWGYSLNIGNKTARCAAGRWRPKKPECVTRPCELLPISHGTYLDGYRPGLTISHGSTIRYSCDNDYAKAVSDPVQCLEGKLQPNIPKCLAVASRKSEFGSSTAQLVMTQIDSTLSETSTSTSSDLCTLPERLHNTLLYRGSTFIEPPNSKGMQSTASLKRDNLPSGSGGANRYFPNETEVLFKCLSAYSGKKTTWKIVCQDGVWVGRPHNCDTKIHSPASDHNRNKSCIFRRPNPDVVAFVKDKKLNVDISKFPPGTEIIYRCTDIGKFLFEGSTRRRCVAGQWTGSDPVCLGLSQEYDYALEKAPTILFRNQIGQIAQSNDGKLIVYPGTVLHLECLWIRKYGTPHWEVSHKNRKYPEGWTSEPGRDSQLEYRLSIYHAKTEDSGLFTCVTPMGHQHAVEIVVSAVHCQPIPEIGGLILSTSVTKMNVKVVFSCEPGRKLKGYEQATCLPSGQWSARAPICQKVPLCPYPGSTKGATISNVKFYYEISETIVFGCKDGYKIQGRTVLQCLDGGRWSGTIPTCHPLKKG